MIHCFTCALGQVVMFALECSLLGMIDQLVICKLKLWPIRTCCHCFNKGSITSVMSRLCKELASSRQCIDWAFLRSVVSPECLPIFPRAPPVISQRTVLCAPGWMRPPPPPPSMTGRFSRQPDVLLSCQHWLQKHSSAWHHSISGD